MKVHREYIPLLHIPIPNRHNPVLIVPTNRSVRIDTEVTTGDFIEFIISGGSLGSELVDLITKFAYLLRKEFGEELAFRISIELVDEVLDSFLYVAITNSITEELCGSIDEELSSVLQGIDKSLGVDDSILALRSSSIVGKAYIWRLGEGYLVVDRDVGIKIVNTEIRSLRYVGPLYPDVVTHIAGLAIIDGYRRLCSGSDLTPVIRVLNSLWYMIYGVEVPEVRVDDNYVVVVKNLSSCCLITFSLT